MQRYRLLIDTSCKISLSPKKKFQYHPYTTLVHESIVHTGVAICPLSHWNNELLAVIIYSKTLIFTFGQIQFLQCYKKLAVNYAINLHRAHPHAKSEVKPYSTVHQINEPVLTIDLTNCGDRVRDPQKMGLQC